MRRLFNQTLFLLACLFVVPAIANGQETLFESTAGPDFIQIEGIVTEQLKYSVKIKSGEKEYTVKVANGAPIALKMNRPWFDWKNNQVVVDVVPWPFDPEAKSTKRAAVKLPAETLHLITRFADESALQEVMATNVKRINYYLITPTDPGAHYPSESELYLSGKLKIQSNQQVQLKVDDKTLPVKLGFQFANMNGFSIMNLKPNKTHVSLSGIQGSSSNEIIATRLLFQPVNSTQKVSK